jgi:cyclohexyl-isocyanide hydratase
MTAPFHIGILLFPNVTQLDATGPAQVLSRVPGAKLHMIWKTLDPVVTDAGFSILPTTTFADCPQLDVICVPGGGGQVAVMDDQETLAFVAKQGAAARYVTSVCTGSLVLGAAGLLQGYRSACHWASRDLLAAFGAIPVAERVVHDRNRFSGGGVTAGIDFGLTLLAEIAGDDVAQSAQLGLEYDPQPPFDSGSPEKAGAERVAKVRSQMAPMLERRRQANAAAAARLAGRSPCNAARPGAFASGDTGRPGGGASKAASPESAGSSSGPSDEVGNSGQGRAPARPSSRGAREILTRLRDQGFASAISKKEPRYRHVVGSLSSRAVEIVDPPDWMTVRLCDDIKGACRAR